jgi:hypothetical protein
MKVITVKQPWAHAIMYLGKDIENRTRHTKIRGTIAIHAGKSIDMDAYFDLKSQGYDLPPFDQLLLGQIIGTVDIVDSVEDHPSKWKQEYTIGYVLKNPIPLKEGIECRGQLGFWNVDEQLL